MEEGTLESFPFNCNICLDSVSEPVATRCGHLYCWSCIYNWLHQHRSETEHTCPSCKSPMSDTTLIPLYGVGSSTSKPSVPNRSSLIHRHRSANHQIMSNSNYGTLLDDSNFHNYRGIMGFVVGLKYECPYRNLDEHGARQGIWIMIWLKLLLSLAVFVFICVLWC